MIYKHFSVSEREQIQKGIWEKKSIRDIAEELGRSPSSISRELKRNNPEQQKRYTPRKAQERALEKRKSRGRTDRLKNKTIRAYVILHLKLGWSPEQISGCIFRDIHERISHEAIYQYVYAQVHRNGNGYIRPGKEDLRIFLRRKQNRRQKKGMRKSKRVFKFQGPSIDLRPQVVDTRKRVGDWEGDTVESCDHKPGVNTLLERKSGLFLVTRVRDKSGSATRDAVEKRMRTLPAHVKRTLTLDNGPENRDWQPLEKHTNLKIYFAHPYHSWERGANENANGLLREYFPKGTDFATVTDEELARVEHILNTRPRKRLGWKTPLQVCGVALEG